HLLRDLAGQALLFGEVGTRPEASPGHRQGRCRSPSFVCLEGPMLVETRAPRHTYRLLPGERCTVPPKTAHYVHGEAYGPCKFLIVQGVGVYDFVAVGE